MLGHSDTASLSCPLPSTYPRGLQDRRDVLLDHSKDRTIEAGAYRSAAELLQIKRAKVRCRQKDCKHVWFTVLMRRRWRFSASFASASRHAAWSACGLSANANARRQRGC